MKKLNFKKFKMQLRDKPVVLGAVFVVLLCLGVLIGRMALSSNLLSYGEFLDTGYTEEINSISFSSGSNPGDAIIRKSANWSGKGIATITLKAETYEIPQNTNQDVILVLDTSLSMTEERVQSAQKAIKRFSEYLFGAGDNRVAFVTFGSTSTLRTDFTDDPDIVNTFMETLEVRGATNYYAALRDVEVILNDYEQRENTELHMIFITDGYPTEMTAYHAKQYQKIKDKHPYLEADAIAFEMGNADTLKSISDFQHSARVGDLSDILYDIVRNSEYYYDFEVTDYIDTTYFEFVSSSVEGLDYDASTGRITLDYGGFKTGKNVSRSFKVKVKDEYLDDYGYFPTNMKTSFVATAPTIEGDITAETSNKPVLKSWYEVSYSPNVPVGCSATYDKTIKVWPFDKVYIDNVNLECSGSYFAGWKVATDEVTMIGSNAFTMPSKDVVIGGRWKSLALAKRMEGTMYSRPTLYKYLADRAVMSNVTSTYVTRSTGINFGYESSNTNGQGLYTLADTIDDEYPVHFYRGDIDNNNLKFGGYCWKIVRTTDTGGVKLLYNGTVTSTGACSTSNSVGIEVDDYQYGDERSYVDSNYVFGTKYFGSSIKLGKDNWYYYASDYLNNRKSLVGYGESGNVFNYSATYAMNSDGEFVLTGDIMTGDGESAIGYYYIPSSSSPWIKYVSSVSTYSDGQQYVHGYDFYPVDYEEANGQDMATYFKNKAENLIWYYGTDVTYDSNTNMYTLVNPMPLKPTEYADNIITVNEGEEIYHYVCTEHNTISCSSVKYVISDSESSMSSTYIELSDGKKANDVLNDLFLNPADNTSSQAKDEVDSWYSTSGLSGYSNYLEDANFCNNRKISNYGGFLKENKTTDGSLSFKASLIGDTCQATDIMNVANGKLKYPVSMLEYTEAKLAGSVSAINNTVYFHAGSAFSAFFIIGSWSPTSFYEIGGSDLDSTYIKEYSDYSAFKNNVRPVISLKHDVYLADGDGTASNPYTVDLGD